MTLEEVKEIVLKKYPDAVIRIVVIAPTALNLDTNDIRISKYSLSVDGAWFDAAVRIKAGEKNG